jgi:hypothetical protein
VGGKSASFHLYKDSRAAADYVPFDRNYGDVFDWTRRESGLPFDKIILEFSSAAPAAELQSLAALLNQGVATATALETHRKLSPRCIHVQTDIDNAPRRLAYVGYTGAATLYFPVPVEKEIGTDAT